MEKDFLFAVKVIADIPDEEEWDETDFITAVEGAIEDLDLNSEVDGVEVSSIAASLTS